MGKNYVQEKLQKEREGLIRKNKFNSDMQILEYKDYDHILVMFVENKNLVNTNWDSFCKGNVKNPFDRSAYGIGYIGVGNYGTSNGDGKLTRQYRRWRDMLKRCYKGEYHTYDECVVCEEWHNFQNFAAWFDENYYQIEGEKMCLDKDILIKGNKIYSPETCVFAPERINTLFSKSNSKRGKYPIGVSINKLNQKYASTLSIHGRKVSMKRLGYFDTPEEAFYCYKEHKEKLIKQVAEHYKDQIPEELYKVMFNYIVEITD
jgi:hypothetical protein